MKGGDITLDDNTQTTTTPVDPNPAVVSEPTPAPEATTDNTGTISQTGATSATETPSTEPAAATNVPEPVEVSSENTGSETGGNTQ